MSKDFYIRTYTGKKYCVNDPRPEDVDLEDIAHALSNQNRFNGHTVDPYNVAQHSWWVSKLCKPQNALWGLMHDATEAYLGDVVAPVKWAMQSEMAIMLRGLGVRSTDTSLLRNAYKRLEQRNWAAVALAFGLDVAEPPDVKRADKVMVITEGDRFVCGGINLNGTHEGLEPANIDLTAWSPAVSKRRFLARFDELDWARA